MNNKTLAEEYHNAIKRREYKIRLEAAIAGARAMQGKAIAILASNEVDYGQPWNAIAELDPAAVAREALQSTQ